MEFETDQPDSLTNDQPQPDTNSLSPEIINETQPTQIPQNNQLQTAAKSPSSEIISETPPSQIPQSPTIFSGNTCFPNVSP